MNQPPNTLRNYLWHREQSAHLEALERARRRTAPPTKSERRAAWLATPEGKEAQR